MTWLTWRQFRTPVGLVTGMVALVVVALVVARPALMDLYRSTGLASCTTDCTQEQVRDFLLRADDLAAKPLFWAGFAAIYLIPAIIGIFWGAPMVARELESGTFRLVWSQGITRSRWLAVKLLAGAGAAMLAAGLLSLAVTWFSVPFDRANDNRLIAEVFGARGIVPIAYAALAFVLGVLIGTVLRRTVPAMAVTLILIATVQVVMPTLVRPNLIPPKHYTGALVAQTGLDGGFEELMMSGDGSLHVIPRLAEPGAWVLSNRAVKADGSTFTGPYDPAFCGRDAGGPRRCEEWVLSQNLHQDAKFQPASRFWPLQWIETALILVVSALLAALTFWWVRRRLS
ncbi:ABC transporter permease subunit [Actinoplanes sp. NBRC 103695]|uniref:ABC transporter permease subunit n=1 Tax=Actinoplanes sp. NBRC 103695 TaxID=3032202 RepID=UPI0024A115DF|nr:ABC transporter permease subunit [Actinoplanes sp. NBRC 103695]GLY97054.1 transporter [Actinoplanes sp. NBRC 103695]